MVTLYLWVRTLLPLLAFVIAWMLLSRLIKARVARLPRVPLNLPEHSSSPRRKDRRIYARKLRRKPTHSGRWYGDSRLDPACRCARYSPRNAGHARFSP